MLCDVSARESLAVKGWAPLGALGKDLTARLLALATETDAGIMRHGRSSDIGFDELWGNPDEGYRRAVLLRIAALMAPFLHREFTGCRPLLYNFFIKRRSSPGSTVAYHQDFAVIDERAGDAALQVWIPLVDVSQANGAMTFIEGTHRDAPAIRPHDHRCPYVEQSLTDLPPRGVRPDLHAGEGVVFSNRTVHGTPPNVSESDRPVVGCILVPNGVSAIHWVRPSATHADLWALTDEDFLGLQPGVVPPSARFVETVEG